MSSIPSLSRIPGFVAALLVCAVGLNAAREVTVERLRTADKEPANWLTYGGSYRSLRYSPLDQIKAANVHTLKAAWAFQLGMIDGGLQSTPLVADGVMYVIGNNNRVFALDATNGRPLWKYFYEPRQTATPTPPTEAPPAPASPRRLSVARGLALGHGHLYFGTEIDNFVVALDVTTGKEVWRTNVEDREKFGCYIRSAPLVP